MPLQDLQDVHGVGVAVGLGAGRGIEDAEHGDGGRIGKDIIIKLWSTTDISIRNSLQNSVFFKYVLYSIFKNENIF